MIGWCCLVEGRGVIDDARLTILNPRLDSSLTHQLRMARSILQLAILFTGEGTCINKRAWASIKRGLDILVKGARGGKIIRFSLFGENTS